MIKSILKVMLARIKLEFSSIYNDAKNSHNYDYLKRNGLKSRIQGNVRISLDSILKDDINIANHSIVTSSTIENEVIIGKFTLIDKSSIGANSSVSSECTIIDCFISKDSQIDSEVRMESVQISPFTRIQRGSWCTKSKIDSYTYIGINSSIHNTQIGKFCSIAANLSSGSGNHPTHMISTSPMFYSQSPECGTSFSKEEFYSGHETNTIGHDVWIGANVFIKSGVNVGNGAIIAAGSVVVKDVEAYSVIGGVPAKEIRKRFTKSSIDILNHLAWWNWPAEYLKKAVPLMRNCSPEELAEWHAENMHSEVV